MELLEGKACSLFFRGMQRIRFDPEHVPHLPSASERLQRCTGWSLQHTDIAYMSDEDWLGPLLNKKIHVTDYIRSWEQLDFIPEPDLFHDYFGHLGFLTLPEYTAVVERFAHAFAITPKEHKHRIARVWWHTFEFGLVREAGTVKLFGAGLISSKEEAIHCLQPSRHRPFNFNAMLDTDKAVSSVHPSYFVLNSLEQLGDALGTYIEEQRATTKHNGMD